MDKDLKNKTLNEIEQGILRGQNKGLVAEFGSFHEPRIHVALVCAAINHEAHHRGQICHWSRELGAPLSPEQQILLWDWQRLSGEAIIAV